MTDTATAEEPQVGGLPPFWWAPGLNLRERLAAPGAPRPRQGDAARPRPAAWSLGDVDGFAARLAGLGLGEDVARALAAETPERLAERAAKPEWARYAERVVASAPEWPAEETRESEETPETDGTPDAEGAEVFLPVLRPLIRAAWAAAEERLEPELPHDELAAVREGFERSLGKRLAHLAARSLVTQLHRARTAGVLAGGTSRERFAAFVAGAGTRQGLTTLFTRYPVLARMLAVTCHNAARNTVELLRRLVADRSRIAEGLFGGTDPGAVHRIDFGRGDAHQGHRAVAVVHFAGGGTVVHKPRPLGQHALLDEVVAWANGRVPGLGLRTPRSVHGAGYGWLEFVEHTPCESATELDVFYRRQGALLALLYALDGVDMHYENVIACRDQPVVVDAETLLHAGLSPAVTAGADPAADALAASVHRTCLLPSLLIGEDGALDISALGGGAGGGYPSAAMRWEGVGTDEMRVLRGRVESPQGQNRPRLRGRTAGRGHADHRAALLEGFRAGYDAVVGHREELLGEDGPLGRRCEAPGRLIARSTRLYTTLLDESAHPEVLRDALTRDVVFSLLCTESAQDPARQRLVEDEIADLWGGDVPLFLHHPARTAVLTSRGDVLEDVLPVPGLRTALDKIAAMGEVDRHDQEWVISATLAVTGANLSSRGARSVLTGPSAPAVAPEPSRLLSAACGVADEIAARAVHSGGRVNWLGLEQVSGQHWAVLPMGGGLAQGYCGVALFLAQLGVLADADRYTELAAEAVRPLPLLLAALAKEPELSAAVGPGALHGLSGIVYTVARLAPIVGEDLAGCLPDALSALELAAEVTDGEAAGDLGLPAGDGIAEGLAGAVAAAVAVHRANAAPGAGETARRLADRLLARVGRRPAPGSEPQAHPRAGTHGFAEGDAGIGWALLRYAAVRRATDAGSAAAVDRLPASAHAAVGGELLGRAVDAALERPTELGWYSGLAGVALAAADTAGTVGAEASAARLETCAARLDVPAHAPDLSLRHGVLGSLEALAALAAVDHPRTGEIRSALTYRTGEVLGRLDQHGHRCGTPDHVPSPGFLTGLSGIGYALLRLAFPDRVPSVLLLDTAPASPGGSRTT
ncbi:type 2 lanthipeptide synthetase LanM family protein [Streptomyces sp. GSL17-111]|uniref:type 2 lanthipeptide synthetase LanM family protein n=1 Tax=Streptomyces sp. GSL17-111 TaxID=3121596 RepID=UPI0030F4304D